ncbi:MAG: dienelactone hydrolase family protein [Microthrixaceae bacterium]|nr:dienelactone hydrolase family protein [Microthrixaceae bacterium]
MTSDDDLLRFPVRAPKGAGSAYLVRPGDDGAGRGHGVLVLHSWWGLNRAVKDFCNRLCDEGFVVLAPDLFGGRCPATAHEAQQALDDMDPNAAANLVLSSAVALRSASDDPSGPISVVGFSMGASLALWAAARQPESFDRVVIYYGTSSLDFSAMTARVLGHFVDDDVMVSDDDVTLLSAELFEAGSEPVLWHYPDAVHWFAEPGEHGCYDEAAAELAWQRTLDFLKN